MRRCEDDVKMWRCEEDVKNMWRWCEDPKMWRCEDVKMRRCEDKKMWRSEEKKMWRFEDVKMIRWEDVMTDLRYYKNPSLRRSGEKGKKHSYTQTHSQADNLHKDKDNHTRKHFYTKTFSHTHTQTPFIHRRFYTQPLWHTEGNATQLKSEIFPEFLTIELHFMRKGCDRHFRVAILPQILTIEPDFVRKGFAAEDVKSQFCLSFERSNLISYERVATDTWKSQFYHRFWRSNLISCEKVSPEVWKLPCYPRFWRSNLISCKSVAFRGASLALPCALREK